MYDGFDSLCASLYDGFDSFVTHCMTGLLAYVTHCMTGLIAYVTHCMTGSIAYVPHCMTRLLAYVYDCMTGFVAYVARIGEEEIFCRRRELKHYCYLFIFSFLYAFLFCCRSAHRYLSVLLSFTSAFTPQPHIPTTFCCLSLVSSVCTILSNVKECTQLLKVLCLLQPNTHGVCLDVRYKDLNSCSSS